MHLHQILQLHFHLQQPHYQLPQQVHMRLQSHSHVRTSTFPLSFPRYVICTLARLLFSVVKCRRLCKAEHLPQRRHNTHVIRAAVVLVQTVRTLVYVSAHALLIHTVAA